MTPALGASQHTDAGQAVMVNSDGINHRAHLIGTDGKRYHIRYDDHREGRPDEEWVGVERLKGLDYRPFKPAVMPATLPVGRYTCSMFVTGTGLVNNGEFTLAADGSYERGGTHGRYTYKSETGRVTFTGRMMDGRAAQFEARALDTLHLTGNAGRVLAAGEERFVASCERK
jgi:hypothetical protein